MLSRFLPVVILALFVASLAGAQGWPDSMVVLGDSISRAVFADDTIIGLADGQPWHCWSTGGCPADDVFSHYERILAENPAIHGNNYNVSESGTDMDDLVQQANDAVATGAEYVNICMGANDLCKSQVSSITTPDQYEAEFTAGLDVLLAGLPDAVILVTAMPDMCNLWDVGHNDLGCLFKWALFGFCDAVLRSSDADRAVARALNIEFNNRLSSVCMAKGVVFDPDMYNVKLTMDDLSLVDCAHFAESAHQKLADATYDPSRF